MEKLKPCPFCGSEAKIIYPFNGLYAPAVVHAELCGGPARIICTNPLCGAALPIMSDVEVVKLWNRENLHGNNQTL